MMLHVAVHNIYIYINIYTHTYTHTHSGGDQCPCAEWDG